MKGDLRPYAKKRDFTKTPEPGPDIPSSGEGPLAFLVQKHAASRLHYDFRLEVDGVLKSWSVPKGPSLNNEDKRLAVMVEDHPFDYGSFEGIIPRGEYGAGQVILWDNGTYSPDEDGYFFHDRQAVEVRMRQGLIDGKLSFTLRGRKLKGSFTLVRTTRAPNEWLLIKHRDRFTDPDRDILAEDRSVVSALSIEDLKAGHLPDPALRGSSVLKPSDPPKARRAPFPDALAPMLATLTQHPFVDPAWLYEPKLDGVRTLALVRDGAARLLSRRGLDASKQYPTLAAELAALPDRAIVLDGEIIALDERGLPSFELLQGRINLTREADILRAEGQIPVLYYVFDLLYLDGYDLRAVPLTQRRELLERVFLPTGRLRLIDQFAGDGVAIHGAMVAHGFEGSVAKRKDSPYEAGKRSPAWRKVKETLSDDFVIAGYTAGEGNRAATFGALLLATYDERDGLVFAGHVGSGFDDPTLASLTERLTQLRADACPFPAMPPLTGPTIWVRPELVAEVKFAQWTGEGQLRAPVFLRLRDDKPPREARVLAVAPVASAPAADPPAVQQPGAPSDIEAALDQITGGREKLLLAIGPHRVALTNLDKPLWPVIEGRRALTKRDLLVYLARIAPVLLPHLRDRPLTLTRYPNGIGGKHFYQKHWEHELPPFVDSVRLFSEHNDADGEYLLCNNLPTLLWLGQLADIELHTWYSRIGAQPDGGRLPETYAGSEENIERSRLNYPDFIVFDLDPYIYSGQEAKGAEPELNRRAFARTREVALSLKALLDSISLSSFVKTTGKTGLHIYVPILRTLDYDTVRASCETIGRFLIRQHPRDITMDWTVDKRTGKVFFDHNQNVRGKTLASIYSPRPLPEAAVSMPLRWDELEKDGQLYPTDFTILTAPDRVAKLGDLWADILHAKRDFAAL